jgi:hypothetical protein
MPDPNSNTPQGDDHDIDDDMICGACGARYLPDRLALECEVCAAEDHTVEVEF